MALVLSTLLAACGSNGGQSPILGTGGLNPVTVPTVTLVTPLPNATGVATNTQLIAATFSKAMDPATLLPSSFTLACPAAAPLSGTVSYVAASQVATLTLPVGTVLPSNTVCTATVTTAVKDSTAIALANNFVWQFTTGAAADTTAPTVTSTLNANGATAVPINTRVGATFSEAIAPATITATSFTLQQTASGAPVAGTTSYSGLNAVFVPTSLLAPNTQYTATITTAVTDLAGNPMAANYVWSWTTAAAADTTAPRVIATVNANNATNVPINTRIDATFSEALNPLTVTTPNFSMKQTVSGAAVAGVASYSGVDAVFIPLAPLLAGTQYTMTIKGGAGGVTDLAGNPMAADYVWSWTTAAVADITAPRVIATVHPNNAINVPINTRIDATFSEALDPLTVTTTNFSMKQTLSGAAVAGVTSYSGVDAVFIPLSPLLASTQYTMTIKGAAGGVADLAANPMAADYVWSWTTAAAADTTAPTVTLVSPVDLATGVATNTAVNATFSEAMDPLTINTSNFTVGGVTGVVTFNALNNMATFTPNASLAAGTTYTATVTTGATDLAGNPLATNKVWSFTTAATPVVVPPIALLTAAPFGTFGGTAGMTNTGISTQVNGDIGTIATGTSMVTGFHDTLGDIYTETPANIGAVNGKIYTCTNSTTGPTSAAPNAPACAIATQARLDAQAAYLALVAKPVGGASPAPGANLAGVTLLPGTYVAPGGSFLIQGGNLTLDAQGDANAVWVFQMASTLTVGGPGAAFPQSIILANGALAKNVFWQVGSFATINAAGGGTMVGTIIAQSGASFSTVGNTTISTLEGRVLSLGASVTLVNTVINVPAP